MILSLGEKTCRQIYVILSNEVVLFLSQSIIETLPLAREDKSKCAVANRHGSFAAGS